MVELPVAIQNKEMDRRYTPAEVSDILGVSLPTVHTALDKLGVPRVGRGYSRLIDGPTFERIIGSRASVPETDFGLTRTDILVAAVLARRPLGLESARAVARAAGISPTAAGHALQRLHSRGLITRETRGVPRGKAVTISFWKVDSSHSLWRDGLYRLTKRVSLLPMTAPNTPAVKLPVRFHHLFWNAIPQSIDVQKEAFYVAARLLTTGNVESQLWAVDNLPIRAVRRAQRVRGLDPRTSALVDNLIAARRRG
jgi:DNA-binding Lrp family transcriptional regulator